MRVSFFVFLVSDGGGRRRGGVEFVGMGTVEAYMQRIVFSVFIVSSDYPP